MERTFVMMAATIAAVLAIQTIGSGSMETVYFMLQKYFPMLGSIFVIAMLLNSANHFIPQSISNGGTRKEIFAGMEVSVHLMLCQMILVGVVCSLAAPEAGLIGRVILEYILIHLLCTSMGNFLCACSLRWGTKIGMILYFIVVFAVAISVGVLVSLDQEMLFVIGNMGMGILFPAAILLDLLMMAVCFLAIKNYEVR